MSGTPKFTTWELAVGAGVGAAVIAVTGWAPISVLLGAAVIAIFTSFRGNNWPVSVGVVLALWALNAVWQPFLPDQVTPDSLKATADAVSEGIDQ